MENMTFSYPFLRALVLVNIIFLLAGDSWLAYAGLVSPPSAISLIEPSDALGIELGTTVPVGMSIPVSPEYLGLLYFVQINVTYPNGTTGPVVAFGSFPEWNESTPAQNCTPLLSGVSVTGNIIADQEGTYVVQNNISYFLSSDPSQANSTYCGPPPFTHQTWILNSTFVVESGTPPAAPLGVTIVNEETTIMTTLPSTPTGEVNVNAAGPQSSISGCSQFCMLGLALGWLIVTVLG